MSEVDVFEKFPNPALTSQDATSWKWKV